MVLEEWMSAPLSHLVIKITSSVGRALVLTLGGSLTPVHNLINSTWQEEHKIQRLPSWVMFHYRGNFSTQRIYKAGLFIEIMVDKGTVLSKKNSIQKPGKCLRPISVYNL